MYYKAFIRVVKSIIEKDYMFDTVEVVREMQIKADSKDEVKKRLLQKYPQFFQNGKIYEKETKDKAQFFYVIIYPLSNYELKQIEEGYWVCEHCKQVHENRYISRAKYTRKPPFSEMLFCDNNESIEGYSCLEEFKKIYYSDVDMQDDEFYINSESKNYIYKCTEKETGKCYIGKTRNAPFFRWWNHLTHSSSPFGIYLRKTKLSDWTFEVLEILELKIPDSEIFKIETEYIKKFNSIENGFNKVVSSK